MENNFNVSYITLDGFIELHKYKYLYFLIMFTAYILIICCNSTIVCLIVIHRNLHEPMYVFIAALLVNSLLFSTALYPKILTDVLSEKQIISYSACLFQFHIFYSLGGSEFLLLAAMSYDRYVSICKPLQYATIMRKSNISLMLLLAWILPSCQFAVSIVLSADAKLCNFTFSGIICNSTIFKLHCVSSGLLNIYGLFSFVCILLLPVLFILFTYTRILIISYRSSREVRRKAAQTCLPHLLVLINFSCLSSYDVLLLRLQTDFPKIVRLIMTLQVILYHPLFNPIIYGVKMKEISKHLKTLFSAAKTI
ncbi:olfactory receptor 6K3-like [Anabas testudineus]|uniref:olfactory receptor 6K3-like n=1 Tax=Anabas testudineus TaxID=64144 RepID=UPI000E4620C1|nr:olfactory receptor 6K3-like [Anabas testudineus]